MRTWLTTHTVPMHDTGIGRDAGYEDDAALLEAAKAERDALSPEMRQLVEEVDARICNAVVNGTR